MQGLCKYSKDKSEVFWTSKLIKYINIWNPGTAYYTSKNVFCKYIFSDTCRYTGCYWGIAFGDL